MNINIQTETLLVTIFGISKNGFCKRYPPTDIERNISDFKLDKIRFPIVSNDDWCGEYAEIKPNNLRINDEFMEK